MRVTLRRVSLSVALLIVVIAAWWAFALFVGPPVPEPTDLDQMDPIIAEAIREAVDSARWQRGNDSRRMTLGMVYEAHGMYGLAMACYAAVAEVRPHDARLRYRIAHVEERSGDLAAAIEAAQRAVELDRAYQPARAQLGLWLLDDGKMDEAAALFRAVVERQPDNEAALFGIVLHAIRAREPERAAKLLLEYELLEGSNPGYAGQLDLAIRRQLGLQVDLAEAGASGEQTRPRWLDPWNDAVMAHQTGVRLLRRAARVYMGRGDYAGAAGLLERAHRAEPGNTRILITLATCYRKQERIAESLAALDEACRLDPDGYWTNLNRADMLLTHGGAAVDVRSAYEHAQAATRARPESGDAWALVGRASQALRRFDEAIDAFLHAYEMDSRDSSVLTQAGFLLYEQARVDAAEQLFHRVCELDEKAGSPRIGLAMIAMDRQQVNEAAALLQEARELRHDHGGLWKHAAERLRARRVQERGNQDD